MHLKALDTSGHNFIVAKHENLLKHEISTPARAENPKLDQYSDPTKSNETPAHSGLILIGDK